MKKNVAIITILLFSSLSIVKAQVHLKGEIGVRLFESSDNPHIVDEPITITKGATVTIKKGTVFLFKNYAGLKVQGSLIIQGTEDEPVIFTSFNDKKYNPDAKMYPNAFDWNGLSIEEASGTIELHHFILMYSVYGVKSKNDKILINRGRFSNNGQCDVVINDKMKVVLKGEPFSYSHTKIIKPVPVGQSEKTGKKDTTDVALSETLVPPTIIAKPVLPADLKKPVSEKVKKDSVSEKKVEAESDSQKEEPKKDIDVAKVETDDKKEPIEHKPPPGVSRDDKNKNRAGIRISFTWLPGNMRSIYYWDKSEDSYKEKTDWDDEKQFESLNDKDGYSGAYYNKLLIRPNIYFMIKAGKFLTIDIGPGMKIWNNAKGYKFRFYDTTSTEFFTETYDWQLMFVAPSVSGGINFVKRFHPLKLNVGFLFDVNLNIIHFSETVKYNTMLYNDYSHNNTDFRVSFSYGPRVGVEILAGQHFGFSADFILRWDRVTTDIDFVNNYDQKWRFYLPLVGLGGNFNFYF